MCIRDRRQCMRAPAGLGSLASAVPSAWHEELRLRQAGASLPAAAGELKDKALDLVKSEVLQDMRDEHGQDEQGD
eukprot:8440987-Pyramimonas_sp.AAC.1